LEDFAERELAELSEGAVPPGLGRQLLRRGKVLLLLDGLDEVAEDALRAEVCKYLEWQLLGAERRGVRAVVSCRPAGYGGAVQLGESFGSFEVRALDAQQVNQLVRLWFREVGEVWPRLSPQEAREKAEDLVTKLASEE
jgi:predicted NACHT family NTPase